MTSNSDAHPLFLTTREGHEVYVFDSMADVASYQIKEAAEEVVRISAERFIGRRFKNFSEAVEASKLYWEDGIKVMEKFIARLSEAAIPEIKSVKAKKKWNSEEGELDFDRMMSGNPDYFCKTEPAQVGHPIDITVIIDTVASAEVSSQNILWRGAAAIALVKLLEDRGYRTEIWATSSASVFNEYPSRNAIIAINLKRPGEGLDTASLINAVSGWFFRTGIFGLFSSICARKNRTIKLGLGYPYTPTASDLDLFIVDQKRIFSAGVFSFEGALGLMVSEIQRIASEA